MKTDPIIWPDYNGNYDVGWWKYLKFDMDFNFHRLFQS